VLFSLSLSTRKGRRLKLPIVAVSLCASLSYQMYPIMEWRLKILGNLLIPLPEVLQNALPEPEDDPLREPQYTPELLA
jgi:hypothetical protein